MEPIFISYVHENIADVEKLCQELTTRGINIWLDEHNLEPGGFWKQDIQKTINNGPFFIACFSKESNERYQTYMNRELIIAIEKLQELHRNEKWFIPIKLNECEFPYFEIGAGRTLEDLTYVKLYENWKEGIQRIVKVIQAKFPEVTRDANPNGVWDPGFLSILRYIRPEPSEDTIDRSPENAEEYTKCGDYYHSKGKIDLAIENYKKAIELKSNYSLAYNKLGNVYNDKKEVTKALNNYNIAINLDPESPYAYNGRGTVHRAKREYDKAIKDYTKAIEIDPNYVTPYNSLGKVYREKGEFDLAIENYNKAIALKPDYALLYNNRGVAYRRKGEFDQAIKDFTKAIELSPDFVWPYSNRGNAYKDKGEFDRALEEHSKAIEINPNYSDAYLNRGNVYFLKGDFERAIEDYSKAIETKEDDREDDVDAYCNRGEAYLHLKEWVKAEADLKTAKDMGADISDSFHNTYESVEDFEQKTGIHLPENIAALLTPQSFKAYNNRGNTYTQKSDFDNAIKDYTKAIELNSEFPQSYYNRGIARIRLKEWEKAKSDLTTAKRMGLDIVALFHNAYKGVEKFEKRFGFKLPEDIAHLLTERLRTRYPKTRSVLDADGNPLESPTVLNLLAQLRKAGMPLGKYVKTKPAFGINTTPTDVFVVDKVVRDELIAAHPGSEEILKPFLQGEDIRRWHVDTPQRWLIFAHRGIAINDYPAILAYLGKHRKPLSERKGKQAWYELAASLADAERFAQPKLVCPNTYNHQTFAVDTVGYYYGKTGYLIPTAEKWLCGLLNSGPVEWFYSQTSKQLTIDYLHARSGYIQQIPIPDVTSTEKAVITKFVDYLIFLQQQPTVNSKDLKHARDRIMLRYFEGIIDGLVYEIYLTEELHQGDKHFLQPLLDEKLPTIEEVNGDKMEMLRNIFELLYERTHLVMRNLYYLSSVQAVRIIRG